MTRQRGTGPGRRGLSAADVPALADFARGYLHEDVLDEHGSAVEAARAFSRVASPDQRRALADEVTRVVAATWDWPSARLARWFRDELGAAWSPSSVEDLEALRMAVDPPK